MKDALSTGKAVDDAIYHDICFESVAAVVERTKSPGNDVSWSKVVSKHRNKPSQESPQTRNGV